MRTLLVLLTILAPPAMAGDGAVTIVNGIRMIDATKLSVAEIQAMAAAERENPTHVNCCDWSGGGCNPDRARALMGLGARLVNLASTE